MTRGSASLVAALRVGLVLTRPPSGVQVSTSRTCPPFSRNPHDNSAILCEGEDDGAERRELKMEGVASAELRDGMPRSCHHERLSARHGGAGASKKTRRTRRTGEVDAKARRISAGHFFLFWRTME